MIEDTGLLDPLTIPLYGRHMIEASAGTGKTYNITRIYVRLLVESRLTVKQILVMTFTEAATEEIKDRLASFIEELLRNFYLQPCEFSKTLQDKHGIQSTHKILSIAHLELDLASIYTINGFCQRVIGRFGLSMSLPQNAELLTDFRSISQAYLSDALRALRSNTQKYILLQNESFHDPDNFLQNFESLLGSREAISVPDAESFLMASVNEFNACWASHEANRKAIVEDLLKHESIVYQGVKGGAKAVMPELDDAINWLSRSVMIPKKDALEFMTTWLGLQNRSKEDSKVAEGEIINVAFNKLFSKVRINNYVKAGMPADHVLIVKSQALLADIKTPKGLGDIKKMLTNKLKRIPLYQVVYQIINSVNEKVEQHKHIHGVIGFNDQIEGVARAMKNSGAALIESLQQEYPAALVDEFQDTDEHQYSILEHLYPKGEQAQLLLMIGDPKQAIYSFRGGDIYTYLRAKKGADFRWGMDVNYRSSKEVITCYNRLFNGAPIGSGSQNLFDEDINYPLVKAPENPPKTVLIVDSDPTHTHTAFSFICANSIVKENRSDADDEVNHTPTIATKDVQVTEILRWCANETMRLLADVYIDENGTQRRVKSEDIAILVRSRGQATIVKQIFANCGLATVFLGEKTPLFESRQALHVLWFLQAVHQPTRENIRQSISTGLVNIDNDFNTHSVDLLIDDGHAAWETVFANLANYRVIWSQKGVYALLQSVIQQAAIQSKESERQLTNYMHIAELLATAAVTNSSALLLIHWLHKQITEAKQSDAHELRLESDQKLIKIVTQHKSKGLEYPVVFLPFANHIYTPSSAHSAVFHNENLERVTQLGVTSDAKSKAYKEALAEDMRLLYVSLTRPILRCYLGVFTLASSNKSALMRALNLSVNNKECDDPGRFVCTSIKQYLADISPFLFVSMADDLLPIKHDAPKAEIHDVSVLPLIGNINKKWQLTSFSKLSRKLTSDSLNDPQNDIFSASKHSFSRDEEESKNPSIKVSIEASNPLESNVNAAAQLLTSYRFIFPKGPDAGNLLHDILELIDFASPDVSGVLASLDANTINMQTIDKEKLSVWIEEILLTPLMTKSDFCLQTLHPEQVLKESEFYFPIESANTQGLLNIVSRYRKNLSDQFSITLPAKIAIQKEVLHGAMHGFIDLIFEFEGKYYVADYKSNFLGENLQNYEKTNLCQDIIKHNYDIQYLIYTLALHRYLTAFLPDYDYNHHFGGVYYLYLRGMGMSIDNKLSGKDCGIFYHKVEAILLNEIDKLFNVDEYENVDGNRGLIQ
jgi:exodeoxyribonuclease V beta subunit